MLNIWIVVKDSVKDKIVKASESYDKEYDGSLNKDSLDFLQTFTGLRKGLKLFKISATNHGSNHTLLSLYKKDMSRGELLTGLLKLEEDLGESIIVSGAWRMDGSRLAGFNVHPLVLKNMPDKNKRLSDGSIVTTTAVDISDVNLLAGQQPRDFS